MLRVRRSVHSLIDSSEFQFLSSRRCLDRAKVTSGPKQTCCCFWGTASTPRMRNISILRRLFTFHAHISHKLFSKITQTPPTRTERWQSKMIARCLCQTRSDCSKITLRPAQCGSCSFACSAPMVVDCPVDWSPELSAWLWVHSLGDLQCTARNFKAVTNFKS